MTYVRRRAAAVIGWLERHPIVLPALILLSGALFRLYNINWDDGHQLHPDERGIYMLVTGAAGHPPLSLPSSPAQLFDAGKSPLNPHYFAYGSLPYYVLAALAAIISFLGVHVPALSSWSTLDTYSGLPMVGRPLSAACDLTAIAVVYVIARRMFDYWTAVLALALCSWTVLDIQISHFYQVDSLLLPLVMVTMLACVVIAQTDDRKAYLWGGVALGAALATKTTSLLLVVPLAGASFLAATRGASGSRTGSPWDRAAGWARSIASSLNANLVWLLGSYVLAAGVFALCDPYAILDRAQLLSDLGAQQTFLVSNSPPFQVPFTIQYANTMPYVYQIQNLLFWCLGLPLGLAALGGAVYFVWRNVDRRLTPDQAVVLLWIAVYFLFVGRFFAKFNRYMLPVTPLMIVFGAAMLVQIVRGRRVWARAVGWISLLVVAAGSLGYSLAYMNIYAHANTRVAASRWMYGHVPAGSLVATEGNWDDALPLPDGNHSPAQYRSQIGSLDLGLNLYDPDTHAKVVRLADILSRAQYLVMSSERMDRSIPKLAGRYPMTIRYYNLLFNNRLPYRLVEHFQQHPQLGPIVVHDYSADESFHVYDHPDVRIYKRVAAVSPARLVALLQPAGLSLPGQTQAATTPDTRLMLTGKQWARDQQGSSLDQMFPPNGFAARHPILVWLLVLELLGLIAFPFAALAFGALSDGGFVVAKTVALLVLGYLVWIAVRAGLVPYDRGAILGCLALFALASAVLAVSQRRRLWEVLRLRGRSMLGAEAAFLVGFAIFVGLRMWYPDLGHQFSPVSADNIGQGRMGEKQMELAFINAIVRSRVFPPYDPFFAHGYINYYYYGFFLVGTLCKLTQIAPATGFNLAIATFFALLAGGVFSVASTLTRRASMGAVAVLFTGLIGNLNGAWQLLQGLMSVATTHLSTPLLGGVVDVVSGARAALVDHQALPPFDFWQSTRIVPPVGSPITEFPFFTYLFADLHPHLMALPMTVAAVALAVDFLYRTPPSLLDRAIRAGVGAVLVGAIAVTNPWDFPTYVIVILLAWIVGGYAARRRLEPGALLRRAPEMGALLLATVVLYIPFKHDYQTVFASGIGLVRDITPQTLYDQGLCQPDQPPCPSAARDALQTPLRIYLEHFGLFAFIIGSYLILLLMRSAGAGARLRRISTRAHFAWYYRDRLKRVRHAAAVSRRLTGPPQQVVDGSLLLGFTVLALGLFALGDYLLAFLVTAFGLIVLLLGRLGHELDVADLFVVALLLIPVSLSVLTQVFFVKDWLSGGLAFRMNTIFKFYNQIWVIYAICATVGLHRLLSRWQESQHQERRRERPAKRLLGEAMPSSTAPLRVATADGPSLQVMHSRVVPATGGSTPVRRATAGRRGLAIPALRFDWWGTWFALLVALLAGSLVYTYAGTVSRETYRQTWLPENSVAYTLDGMAFMKVAYPGDYAGISWLNAHVRGAQVVAEAGPGYYDWRSRVSMFTGLPSIINGIHEGVEQRYPDEMGNRVADVNTLYSSPRIADAWRVIREYDVHFIFVGFSETQCAKDQCYPRTGLAKFRAMVNHGLTVAFRARGITIYRVVRA